MTLTEILRVLQDIFLNFSGRISNVNNADDAYIRAPYRGSGNVTISGNALIQVQLFQPAFTQVWII